MGRIGRTYPRYATLASPSASALAHFDRPFTAHEERTMRRELTAGIVGLLGVLALIGWLIAL